MASALPSFNPQRLRSYVFRLPLFTRIILLVITVFWLLELQSVWDVVAWGALIPAEMGLGTSEWIRLLLLLPGPNGVQMQASRWQGRRRGPPCYVPKLEQAE